MSLSSEFALAVTDSLENLLNQVLQQDQASLEKLARLQAKVIALEFSGLNLPLYLFPHSRGIQVQFLFSGDADTTLTGSPLSFAEMALGDATRSLFKGTVRISGDIELGQRFKRILDNLHIDWEAWLAQFSGDLLAHKTATLFRQLHGWQQHVRTTLSLDTQEYLQQESQLNPRRQEISEFSQAVSSVRDGVARLEARLQRLQQRLTAI